MAAQIDAEFEKVQEKTHYSINGLRALIERLKFLQKMEPMRDIDYIKINELHDYSLNLDIELDTVGDFQIDKARFTGFHETQQLLRSLVDEKLRFLPVSRARLETTRRAFEGSTILDWKDED